ncbi:hypothetical protein V2J09_006569 [Rumex salicifolius]
MAKFFQNVLPTLFLCALLCFLLSGYKVEFEFLVYIGVEGGSYGRRLFVFGDSYADTGNINKSFGGGWKVPYGITFPGQPSGRFSDGRVLTDFIAMFLKQNSPIPYTLRKLAPLEARNGVNFAFGGTGVFDTTATIKAGLPNMTTQIDLFQHMLSGNDVIRIDGNLAGSIAYVSLVGNDYDTFLSNVVNQLSLDLERILALGFRRILVTGLQPLGCSPKLTASDSFQQCTTTFNLAVQLHNLLLQQAIAKLNNENRIRYRTSKASIYILDLYNSFFVAFQKKDAYSGGLTFENPLKPCCFGISTSYSCGDVDENGNKLYTICNDRKTTFYWDANHPTQAGWEAVYPTLEATLQQALY